MDFTALAQNCAPNVHADTLHRIASVESSFNPYAIGVVGGRLQRQPRNAAEAIATQRMLEAAGYNYSLGIAQVNKKNLGKYGLTPETAFDPCENLRAGGLILEDCYRRAGPSSTALSDAFSCYYTGNFTAGYRLGYVAKVQGAPALPVGLADDRAEAIPIVPKLTARSRVMRQAKSGPVIAVPSVPGSNPLFVSVPTAPPETVAVTSDTPSSQQKGPATALLF